MILGFAVSGTASAALIDRGNGLIYDSDQDITWVQDANLAQTSGFDADGLLTFAGANAWASGLVFGGFSDWRLPITVQPDTTCADQVMFTGFPDQGFGQGCTGSELGHLFNVDGISESTPGLFTNVQNDYWSSEFALDTTQAWDFIFSTGGQLVGNKNGNIFAWAVRDGDVLAPGDITQSENQFLEEFGELLEVFAIFNPIDLATDPGVIDTAEQAIDLGQQLPGSTEEREINTERFMEILAKTLSAIKPGGVVLELDPDCDFKFEGQCFIFTGVKEFEIINSPKSTFQVFTFDLSVQVEKPAQELFAPGDRFVMDIPFLGPGSSFSVVEVKSVVDPPEFGTIELSVEGVRLVAEPFAGFNITEVEIEGDEFEVEGSFSLGAGSDGKIDPLTEEVTFQVGTFSITIQAGSFELDDGTFEFEGDTDGVELEVEIKPLGGDNFEFEAEGKGVDLTGTVNPVDVTLTIGDDTGTATVNAEFD